jgi:ferredoxin-thioredoxin reductase catalytic subunit
VCVCVCVYIGNQIKEEIKLYSMLDYFKAENINDIRETQHSLPANAIRHSFGGPSL